MEWQEKMQKRNVVCVFVAALSLAAGAAELVVNGSFDEGKAGWSPRGLFAFDSRGGQNGTAGLRWKNSDAKAYQLVSQSLKLKTGMKYRYSCWARQRGMASSATFTERNKPTTCGICIGWNDADGKWIAEVSQTIRTLADCEWTKLEGETPPMPANAKTFSVSLYVGRSCTGEAWFDDVSVEPVEVEPVTFLASSVYRDVAASGETVEFRAVLKIDDEATPLSGLKAEFSFEGEDGAFSVAPDTFTAQSASVKVPARRLKSGGSAVRFALFEAASGRGVGRATLPFARVDELPRRKAWIDRHNRLIVDGKPFFPLGMYLSHVNTNQVDAYAKGPWNCALPYVGGKWADLDYMASKSLKVIYGLHEYWANFGRTPRFKTEEEASAACRRTVLSVKDHPAIIAWYSLDEMPLKFMPRMLARQRMMREIDPDHPTYAVLYQFYQIREYMPVSDVLGTDPYPIGDGSISLPTDHARTVREGTFGMRAMWQVPQAFDWGWFVSPQEYPNRCRLPTAEEARSMTWQSIAGGANGIVYWAYHYIHWRLKGEAYDNFYGAYCRVGEEVKRFIPVIMSVEQSAKVLSCPKAVACRVWRMDGKTYLLMCNTTRDPVEGGIVLDTPFSKVRCELDAADAKVKGSSVSFSLKPMGVTMLHLGR